MPVALSFSLTNLHFVKAGRIDVARAMDGFATRADNSDRWRARCSTAGVNGAHNPSFTPAAFSYLDRTLFDSAETPSDDPVGVEAILEHHMPQGLIRVFNSSKFWTALSAVVVSIFAVLNLDPTKATTIVSAVSGLAIAVIAATGYEDGQQKAAGDVIAPPTASTTSSPSNIAKLLLLVLIPAMLLSGGCQYLQTPAQSDLTAERATYAAVGPDWSKYYHADPTLRTDQVQRRDRTLETWQLRVGATQATQPAAVGD